MSNPFFRLTIAGEIANTGEDALYRNLRTGAFSYSVPSGNGTFNVTLHFNETWFGYRTGGGGSRKFKVDIEGVRKLSNFYIFATAGGAMRAVRKTFRVSDGTLNLYFSKGTVNNPAVAAIEVVAVTGARIAASVASCRKCRTRRASSTHEVIICSTG